MPIESQTLGLDEESIVHARRIVGETLLMNSDEPAAYVEKPAVFSVSLIMDTNEEAERIFAAFAYGGSVGMPITETFWAHRFGMWVDKFGVPWMIHHEKPRG